VPLALRASGWSIELHDDHFPQNAKDVDLLPEVARRGWIFVTQDAHIRYRAAEKDAWLRAGLRAFVVVTANLGAEDTTEILERARKRIETLAAEEPPPFIYRIAKDASLRRIDTEGAAGSMRL
jgi:hypothetical protein